MPDPKGDYDKGYGFGRNEAKNPPSCIEIIIDATIGSLPSEGKSEAWKAGREQGVKDGQKK